MSSSDVRAKTLASIETVIDHLTIEDIQDIASSSAFGKGERYQRQGRVLAVDVATDGSSVRARVRGSAQQIYRQQILISVTRAGPLDIAGTCTCPVGYNCKHVVAVLLELHAQCPLDTVAIGIRPPPAARGGAQPSLPVPFPAPPPTLASDLASWVAMLARLEQTETEDFPPEIRQRLIYVLAAERRKIGVPFVLVQPTSIRLLKGGEASNKTHPFSPSSIYQRDSAKFLRPSDRGILKRLSQMPFVAPQQTGTSLSDLEGAAVLEAMIVTGRARWGSVDGPVVTQGPPLPGRFVWRLAEDGTHQPELEVDGPASLQPVRLAPPWYIDADSGAMGPIETSYAPRIAAAILSAPPVPPSQTQLLRRMIAERLPALRAVEPPDLGPLERVEAPLNPGLRLMARDLPRRSSMYGWHGHPASARVEQVLLARPFFRYGAFEIRADDARQRPTVARDGKIVEILRDAKAERLASARLDELGFRRFASMRPFDAPAEHRDDLVLDGDDAAEWLDLLYHEIPALRAEGWDIEIDRDFPLRLVRADAGLSATLAEGSGIDWFELDLGVIVDGERLDLVPALLPMLSDALLDRAKATPGDDDPPIFIRLGDGRVVAVPTSRLRPILAALRELLVAGVIDPQRKRLGFSVLDAPSLAELEAATADSGVHWQGGERLRQLGRLLRATGGIPSVMPPPDFAATLRPYQMRGLDWLQFLREVGLGGILADDMGLGKTVQTLAHLAVEKASGRMDRPVLVVAPTSVVANWRREAERFAPALKVLVLRGTDRKAKFGDMAAHDLVLTTYPLLARDHEALAAQPWHMLVLDEAQIIKNPDAAMTRAVGALEARHRLCLTGTPLQNHLGELWSLFAFLSPGFLGDRQSFQRRWRTPIEKKGDIDRRRLLARRVRPFLLRRTKSEVAVELPPKTEIVESIEMEAGQRDVYESIRLAMHAKVREAIAAKGLARSRIVVLDALLKLRQACCDPRLLKLATAARKARSAKLDRLMEMLPELLEEGRRILLFSQFTSMLALIEPALAGASIPYVLLTGDTRDRDAPIRRFQTGEVPLFLISLKAGGLGLNLTAADTVIHYDPWWNPAVEDQATDRAHRIGQDKAVFVHKLVMLASIEEKMEQLKTRKRDLAQSLFDHEAGSTLELSEADVEALLGPS